MIKQKIISWKNVSVKVLTPKEQEKLIAILPIITSVGNDGSSDPVLATHPVFLNKAWNNYCRWCAGIK